MERGGKGKRQEERESKRKYKEKRKGREPTTCCFTYQIVSISQAWARLKLGAENFIWVSNLGDKALTIWSHQLLP